MSITDQELADKIISVLELGAKTDKLNVYSGDEGTAPYYAISGLVEFMGCDRFVRDWRVAGAMLKMYYDAYGSIDDAIQTFEGDPRAINEACAESLS